MDWDDLRHFLAVARTGNLSDAASQIQSSPATLSRRISALETALQTTLFQRLPRGYQLTDTGQAMLDRLEEVDGALTRLQADLLGEDQQLSGPVRVAASYTIGVHLIVPALPLLQAKHPGITLELISGVQNLNLTRREADLALRLTPPSQGRLVVRKLGVVAHGIYGHRDYVARHCPSHHLDEIRQCNFVLWDEAQRDIPMANWFHKLVKNPKAVLMANDLSTHMAALRAGLGLAVLPAICAARDPALTPVLKPQDGLRRDLYVVVHEELRHSARIRAVIDFLSEAVKQAAPLLSGKEKAPPDGGA
ncbi:MAG: LysR family transcriptional regulator [Rhodospirillaceae bacterium]